MDINRFQIIAPGNLPDYRDRAYDIGVASGHEFTRCNGAFSRLIYN